MQLSRNHFALFGLAVGFALLFVTTLSQPTHSANQLSITTSSTPTATITPTLLPIVLVHRSASPAKISGSNEVVSILSETEKNARWQQGLPVPLSANDLRLADSLTYGDWEGAQSDAPQSHPTPVLTAVPTRIPGSLRIVDGWSQRAEANFDGSNYGFTWQTSADASHKWGTATTRAYSGKNSLWAAGEGVNSVPSLPANSAYPLNMITARRYQLERLESMDNALIEFWLWLQLDNPGDSFSVQVFTGACASINPQTFVGGLQWRGTDSGVDQSRWVRHRLVSPTRISADQLCVELLFVSDDITGAFAAAQGAWIDDLQVWRYQQPASTIDCQQQDPRIYLHGAPGAGLISKGLIVPPYAGDIEKGVVDLPDNSAIPATKLDMAGMVERLLLADVQWVRLEFTLPPELLLGTGKPLTPFELSNIDLRHFDRLVDMLCANNIGVLALVDYQTVIRRDWQSNTQSYIDTFTTRVRQLAKYYQDRIRYWEVGNEPNYAPTGISPDVYAQLLSATYDTIKAVDAEDQVLFAGLAQVGRNAMHYIEGVSITLEQMGRLNPAPYDIMALHPYPSDEYTRSNRVVIDPGDFLRWPEALTTTVIASPTTTLDKFLDLMVLHGKEDHPIWVTEIGWNRAADSSNSLTLTCPRISTTMVNSNEQALYAERSFEILFKETRWPSDAPVVNKVFWYQYMDVGISDSECYKLIASEFTPSYYTSYVAQANRARRDAVSSQGQVDWWFGLYGGIDWGKGGTIGRNPLFTVFRDYPPVVYGNTIYLPVIQKR